MSQQKQGQRKRAARLVRLAGLFLFTASVSFAAPVSAQAQARENRMSRISPELFRLSDAVQHGTVKNHQLNVIVQFTQKPTRHHVQKMANLGGKHLRHLSLINGGAYNLPLSAVANLANDPEIVHVSLDRPIQATSADKFQETVGGDVAHSLGWDGSGVTVAVIDSGISDHPDLHDPVTGASRVIYSESFVPGTDTSDGYGHGTHVAGIIARRHCHCRCGLVRDAGARENEAQDLLRPR